jgi:large subunit ribosomal protein L21
MTAFAIVKINGKQYLARAGEKLYVDRMTAREGSVITLPDVLLAADGKEIKIGTPILKDVKIEARVVAHPRGTKGVAFRYARKKRVRKARGFRADLTALEVQSVKI